MALRAMVKRAFYPNDRADSLLRNINTQVRVSCEREVIKEERRRWGEGEKEVRKAFQQKD